MKSYRYCALAIGLLVMLNLIVPIIGNASAAVTDEERNALADRVDGQQLHSTALDIVNISESHPAFRVAGSKGANETADYILSKFEDIGLNAWKENFNFTTWDLSGSPELALDLDGNFSTLTDRSIIASFQPEAYSWPTSLNGSSAGLEYLPLPQARNYDEFKSITFLPFGYWDAYDITDKIVVIPREISWTPAFENKLLLKITGERPIAFIFAYWYEWNSYSEVMSVQSTGGKPLGQAGDYLWQFKIPSGSVNYSDGQELFTKIMNGTPGAKISIPANIAKGQQSNVVGEIIGTHPEEKAILVTAHYDSVMCPGFVDNAGGVASMIEIARTMQQAKLETGFVPRHTMRFIAFAGEELGMVGSANYVGLHQTELVQINAVINLDCIGNKKMSVSNPGDGAVLNLGGLFREAALSQGINIAMEDDYRSDQLTFLDPISAASSVWRNWQRYVESSKVVPVPDSVSVFSHPLTILEEVGGEIGLVHTSLDAPDQDPAWLNITTHEEQTKVVANVIAYLALEDVSNRVPQHIDPFLVTGIGLGISALILLVLYNMMKKQKKKE